VPAEISVVIPTRGDSPHLRDALRSVRDGASAAEVLLVHDRGPGAPALSAAVVPGVGTRVIESAAPGPAAARNTGLDAATSRFVAFLDDDDAWLPGHPARAMAALEADPQALLVAGDAFVFHDPRPDGSSPLPADFQTLSRFAEDRPAGPLSLRDLLLANRILTPTVVLARERLPSGERFRADLAVMEDYELWLRLARDHRLLFDPHPAAIVRKRADSASRDLGAMAEASLRVFEGQLALGLPPGTLSTREIRLRLGRLWHDLAYARLRAGDTAGARSAAWHSASRLPLEVKNYIYLVATALPERLRTALLGPVRRSRQTSAAGPAPGANRLA
jgi:glycosyltransferase involved in cell wall biosynthesis